jgi:GNAT superfamily N-acetyltransferase
MPERALPPWTIGRLETGHDRGSFDCGKLELNEWLRRLAGQYQRRDLARTYVAVRENSARVFGYYAISNHLVRRELLPEDQAKGLPPIDLPVALLGRLAVDRSVQGQGLGRRLVIDALRRVAFVSEHIGIRAVEVDAFDEDARRFYVKFGFAPLVDDRRHLFLSIHVIRKLELPPP